MSDDSDPSRWRPATRLVRGGTRRSEFDETSEALFLTSGYVYPDAAHAEGAFKRENDHYIYSRFANPTVAMFQDRLALIEGAERCFATASGMAAVFAGLMFRLRAGQRVVASRALFGSCHFIVDQLLPRWGIERVFVDGTDLGQWEKALATPAAAVFLETPSNPTLEVIDLAAVSDLAHRAGAKVVVDNVFATPILQRPMELGADIITYSATKHLDGQGRVLGGAVLMNDTALFDDEFVPFVRNTGPALSPFNAWVLLKGMETLDLRVRRQCESAARVAEFLAGRADVARVLYPGLPSHPQADLAARQMAAGGTIVAFELDGGKAGAFAVLDRLKLIDISNNLGDAKSLITHPATTTHQRLTADQRAELGIGEGLVRLSVGLEDVDDLIEDLAAALPAGR